MSGWFYLIVTVGVIVTIILVWLLVDAALAKYAAWREQRDIRVKNETLNRYNMAAFRGMKRQP